MAGSQKRYADFGVQTSPQSTNLAPPVVASQQLLPGTDSHLISLPTPSHSRHTTESAHGTGDSSVSLLQDIALPLVHIQARLKKQARTSKLQLPYSRPSHTLDNNSASVEQLRSVSLPERFTLDAFASQLFQKSVNTPGPRCVSMPTSYSPFTVLESHGTDLAILEASPTFSIDGAEYARVHISPRTPDIPRTPSPPPSTPDSVEIIESSFRLPEGFLRQMNPSASVKAQPLDNGWLTWTSSPPRPIPALHGPASLPYARCPSGAEGTIIEEQANVPQLIWGLGDDESSHATSHFRSESATAYTSLGTMQDRTMRYHKSANSFHGIGRPRNAQSDPASSQKIFNSYVPPQTSADSFYLPRTSAPPHHVISRKPGLSVHEPETFDAEAPKKASQAPFGNWAMQGTHVRSVSAEKLHEFTSRAVNAGINARRGQSRDNDRLSPPHETEMTSIEDEFMARLQFQEVSVFHKNPERLVNTEGAVKAEREQRKILTHLKGTGFPFVPASLQDFSSPYQHNQASLMTLNRQDMRRHATSTGSTAQLHRDLHKQPPRLRHQYQLQQPFLPTPPDSSSPQWSSSLSPYLSPYPNDMLSPETSITAFSHVTLKNQAPEFDAVLGHSEELPQEFHSFVYDPVGINGRRIANLRDDIRLESSVPIEVPSSVLTPGRWRSQQPPIIPSRLPIPIHLKDLVPTGNVTGTSSTLDLGPQSNFPIPTMPAPLGSKHRKSSSVPAFNTYPSPPSPSDKLVSHDSNLARHRPRSIPLARLIERRLASVPEEDANNSSSYVGLSSTSGAAERKFPGLSPSRPTPPADLKTSPTQAARAFDPLVLTLNPHSQTEALHSRKASKQVKVKLPSARRGKSTDDTHSTNNNKNGSQNKENTPKKKRTRGKKSNISSDAIVTATPLLAHVKTRQ